jgi:hypothetical protein
MFPERLSLVWVKVQGKEKKKTSEPACRPALFQTENPSEKLDEQIYPKAP